MVEELLSEIEIVDQVEKLQQLYDEFQKKANKDLQVILLIGMTGAGKSTIFNFLAGAEFDFQSDNSNDEELQVKQFNDQFSITKGGMISITREPKYYFSETYNHLVIDFPGFQDTRGSLDQLMIQLLFYKIVTTTPTKIVYVIRHPETNFSDRGVSLQQFIQQQFEEQQIEQQKLSLLLNSYNEKLADDKLKERVQKQLKEVYEKVNENIFVLRKVKNAETLSKIFSPESRDKLWEQIIQSNVVEFTPKYLSKSEIISQYLKHTINSSIVQYCSELNHILMSKIDEFTMQNVQELKQQVEMLINILENMQNINNDWYIQFMDALDQIAKYLGFNYQHKTNYQIFRKIFFYFSQFKNFIQGYSECEKAGQIAHQLCLQLKRIVTTKLKQLEELELSQSIINEQKALFAKEAEKRLEAEKSLKQQLNNNQLNEQERIKLQQQFEQLKQESQRATQNFQSQILQIQQNSKKESEELNKANQNRINQILQENSIAVQNFQNQIQQIQSAQYRENQAQLTQIQYLTSEIARKDQQIRDLQRELEQERAIRDQFQKRRHEHEHEHGWHHHHRGRGGFGHK